MAFEVQAASSYLIGNCNNILITDTSGLYDPSYNIGGWGVPNPYPSSVVSVTITPTWQGNILNPPTSYPAYEIMPISYVYNQQFVLTPSMFGINTPTFADGIWNFTYSVVLNSTYTINASTSTFTSFTEGATITDTTTGQVIGIVSTVTTHQLIISPCTGYTVSNGDVLTDGTHDVTISGTFSASFTTSTYTYTLEPLGFLCNAWCCILGNLGTIDWCKCSECEAQALNELFYYYLALKACVADLACLKNGQFLQALQCVQIYCNGKPCGCNG